MDANDDPRSRRSGRGGQILQRERRQVFWLWAVLAGLAVAAALLAPPLAESLELPRAAVAVLIPAVELALLAVGLGWLLRVVLRGRRRARQ